MAEFGDIHEIVKFIKSVFNDMKESVGYNGRYHDNFGSLRKSLSGVCVMKADMNRKVEEGVERRQEISQQAASWLKGVLRLTENEELKQLMYNDLETAKFVVRLMEKNVLKRGLLKESEMQNVVVKLMKMLKDEIVQSDQEMREMAEVDYKKVAEVIVEIIMDTFEEFKKALKEDMNIAIVAKNVLNDRNLDTLTRGDEVFWRELEDDGFNHSVPGEVMNPLNEVARKLITPIGNWLTGLGKLVDDKYFKEIVPNAKRVKGWLGVIVDLWIKSSGLKKAVGDNIEPYKCCHYHDRNRNSKAAQIMADFIIKGDICSKYPRNTVTQSLIFESKEKLLGQILEKLKDDQVDIVGVFGMGGIGKTELANEVSKRANDIFDVKVIVEVSENPHIVGIQATIAESIDLHLHGMNGITQRAIKLYKSLNSGGKKILIILDNVWKKLNLDEIGIPHTCKLLLTTRERDVCRVMSVRDVNILEVGVMETNEARHLLKSQTRNQVDIKEHENVLERLLNKCGGLPHAIVSITNAFQDTDLLSWEKFADSWEEGISNQVSYDYHEIYSILDKSYKFIKVVEKRIFFLLISLFPVGSSVSIESLARYGIGLNLFPCVDKLSEAMDVADTWAKELISSSMLINSDVESEVKIHDFMRTFAISVAAAAEGRTFMEKGSPCWLDDHSFTEYAAFLVMSMDDHYGHIGIQMDKLQILKLRGPLTISCSDSLFERMVNLEVLDVSDINFRPRLPFSMRKLQKLKTLCMEGCELGDIKQIGYLVNLLVLSLRELFLEELPSEIKELCKLRLLDLRGCRTKRVPLMSADVMNRLINLEVLYMPELEIKVPKIEDMQIDDLSIQYLDKFKVFVGDNRENERSKDFSRVLDLNGIGDIVGALGKSSLKAFLGKANWLRISSSRKLKNIVPLLDKDGLKDLESLQVTDCHDVISVVEGSRMDGLIAFPRLQSLYLSNLRNLKMVYDAETPQRTFYSLETLRLHSLQSLQYVMPLNLLPPILNQIDVSFCESLKFIFIHNDKKHAPQQLFLKSLELSFLDIILCLVGSENLSNPQFFFDDKIVFPCLELFVLQNCDSIVKVWSNASGFQNLKDIKIIGCGNLLSVGLSTIFPALVKLESLSIIDCKNIHEVVSVEETGVGEDIIRFPQLKYLKLSCLSKLESFYGGGSNLEFPKLKKLTLVHLPCMKRFAKLGNSSAFFHENINFPCLDDLYVRNINEEIRGLWDRQPSTPASLLTHLTLIGPTPWQVPASLILENLCTLELGEFKNVEVLFSSGEGSRFTYSHMPQLEILTVFDTRSVINLFPKEDYVNGAEEALTLLCGKLKTLHLLTLPKLKLIPLHLFKGLVSLLLYCLKWEYVISLDVLGDLLQQLQYLSILKCKKMGVVMISVDRDIELPLLKKLRLLDLDSVRSFSSTPQMEVTLRLPSLESLDIRCPRMEHFWSGIMIAPTLQDVTMEGCENMQRFLIGNRQHGIEFPSLQTLNITGCPNIKSFSSGRLLAPKLSNVRYDNKEYSMLEIEDLNVFLDGKLQAQVTRDEARMRIRVGPKNDLSPILKLIFFLRNCRYSYMYLQNETR